VQQFGTNPAFRVLTRKAVHRELSIFRMFLNGHDGQKVAHTGSEILANTLCIIIVEISG
jgi:hypothetical protein